MAKQAALGGSWRGGGTLCLAAFRLFVAVSLNKQSLEAACCGRRRWYGGGSVSFAHVAAHASAQICGNLGGGGSRHGWLCRPSWLNKYSCLAAVHPQHPRQRRVIAGAYLKAR